MTTGEAQILLAEAAQKLADASAAVFALVDSGVVTTRWYDVDGYAALMNVSRSTVLRQIQAGQLKATKTGSQWRIEVAA